MLKTYLVCHFLLAGFSSWVGIGSLCADPEEGTGVPDHASYGFGSPKNLKATKPAIWDNISCYRF